MGIIIRQLINLAFSPALLSNFVKLRKLLKIMARQGRGAGWNKGAWNMLENVRGAQNVLKVRVVWKPFGIFYWKNVLRYYGKNMQWRGGGHEKHSHIRGWGMKIVHIFEGALWKSYYHWTVHSTPCYNCWQLP